MQNINRYKVISLIFCASISLLMAIYFLGIYEPKPPYDDVYFPYIFFSGPVVWVAGVYIGSASKHMMFHFFSPITATALFVVVIPGIANMILGSLQWIGIVAISSKLIKKRHH